MICPTPPPGGSAVACPPDGEWDNVDIALPHWTRQHTTNQYRAGVTEHSCFACKATFMGYANRSFLHFSKLAGRAASLQGNRLLDARLLWNCESASILYSMFSKPHPQDVRRSLTQAQKDRNPSYNLALGT